MARITVEDCIDKFPSRFELVLVASQRARKLHSGDSPTVEKDNDKNTVIALREIADSTISVEDMKENLIQEYQTVTINDEEDENLELESLDMDAENNDSDDKNSNKSETLKEKEIEEEISDLISSEDSEIETQYEISDNIDENPSISTSESIADNDEVTEIPDEILEAKENITNKELE